MLTRNEILMVRSLADKSGREEHGMFVVEGGKMVGELLNSQLDVYRLFVTSRSGVKHPAAELVSEKEMERMSRLKTPSDTLAVARIPRRETVSHKGLVLALDKVQDPGNLGTIIRIADWFGVRCILASHDTVDCFNPKVVQATMGALYRVNVVYGELTEMLTDMKQAGKRVYGTMLEGGHDIYAGELDNEGVLVMGSEGKGISAEVAALLDERLFIPPFPQAGSGSESLNVAVATAVAVAEFRRRLHR